MFNRIARSKKNDFNFDIHEILNGHFWKYPQLIIVLSIAIWVILDIYRRQLSYSYIDSF
jgi:hypothetical protein